MSTTGHRGVLRHGELVGHQAERVLHCERLDVHHLGDDAADVERRDPHVHVLRARGREQHVHHLGIVLDRPEHLEVEADLFERVRDVLVGLGLDLALEVVVRQVGLHRDHLGDHGRTGDRGGGELGLGARTRPRRA
jgi:hypothetical protein